MKRFLSLLLAITSAFLMFTFVGCADNSNFEVEEQSNGTVYVTAIKNPESVVTIPEEINGKVVSGIGADAFRANKTVTEVVLPNSVTYIGISAFREASNLTKINLGKVTNIESNAFRQTKLLSADLSSLVKLKEYAFASTRLTSITIPSTITSIPRSAFSSCTTLYSVSLASSVKSIGDNAFNGCNSLAQIDLSNVEYFGEQCFMSCSSLYSLNLASVLQIKDAAFKYCSALNNVTIGENCNQIYCHAFMGCGSLATINLASAHTEKWYIFLSWDNGISHTKYESSGSYPKGWQDQLKDGSQCAAFLKKTYLEGSYIASDVWCQEQGL